MTLDDLISNLRHWSGNRDGATIFIADDAEYCGTTGYYYVKYAGDYSRSFAMDPSAGPLLDALIRAVLEVGPMATFKEACEEFEPVPAPFFVEDRFAWHRTYADAWANTPEARRWEPILMEMRREYREDIQPRLEGPNAPAEHRPLVEKFWFHLTNSANSDGRWPPPPLTTCPFNREWVEKEIAAARRALHRLRKIAAALPRPAAAEREYRGEDDGRYGYRFTDKDVTAIGRLNHYELQHAIYHFHKMVDGKNPARQEEGRRYLRLVFDELDRRGMKGIRPAAARPIA